MRVNGREIGVCVGIVQKKKCIKKVYKLKNLLNVEN